MEPAEHPARRALRDSGSTPAPEAAPEQAFFPPTPSLLEPRARAQPAGSLAVRVPLDPYLGQKPHK